ncbi:hypothetical protein [Methylogaea oryzae]|nr:hypothetical protein [Methylogaea oryzae]
MIETMKIADILTELSKDPAGRMAILTDRYLSADEFAQRHQHTIFNHYEHSGRHLEQAECFALATGLWCYLRETDY